MNSLEQANPNFVWGVTQGGSLGLNVLFILATAPFWIAAVVVYFLPAADNLKYALWLILFLGTIVFSLYLAYVVWKQKRR